VRAGQAEYLTSAKLVTVAEVAGWSVPRRLADNVVAMLGL